ncbi:hypothetical protein [Paenibacillus apiarius]|uniref:hypothetical protein n=1 Tax=Paenibacillus apiarius TaxID=46240 RepID=UPI003B3BDC1B
MEIAMNYIYTRFDPVYIAIGNPHTIVIVQDDARQHYPFIGAYELRFGSSRISVRIIRDKAGTTVAEEFTHDGDTVSCHVGMLSEKSAIQAATDFIREDLVKYRSLIEPHFPNIYQAQGQMKLFE